jgi:3-phosphoshikimate 1-carboxyvinyltransferase
MATMASGISVLRNPLKSADALSSTVAARALGADVMVNGDYTINGLDRNIRQVSGTINVGNSGTTLRIFTALAALTDLPVTFDGDKSIRTRPMTSLFNALQMLGITVNSNNEKCPFTVQGPMKGGKTRVDGISSQFLTAMLFAAPLAKEDIEIEVFNLHEKPYVDITLDWLKYQNIDFRQEGYEIFRIKGNQHYNAFDRHIPADFSSATFALCAAAITGSEIEIRGLDFSDHQGDKEVFTYFEKMGTQVIHKKNSVVVKGGKLKGIDIDMNNTPDALPAMAVAGCFAEGKTGLLNVAQARLKECDRITAMHTELTKMGAKITELSDGLIIEKGELHGTAVHGYDDHRMVMSLAVAGLAAQGETIIDTAESIDVTYPSFTEDMKNMGAYLETSN